MTEPKPWLLDESAPDAVRALIDGASADGPSAAQLARLAARVAPSVGVAATALVVQAGMPTVAPLQVGTTLTGKVAAAGLGKLASATWLKVAIAALVLGAGGYGAVRLMPRAEHGVPPALPAPAPTRVAEPVTPRGPAPVVEVAVEAQGPTVEPPVVAEPPHAVPPAARPSEIALMKEAQDPATAPARALSLLQKHARLYPDGMFAQEREVLAISALITLGRSSEAEARAERMARAYPGSAHLRRVRVLLDGARSR